MGSRVSFLRESEFRGHSQITWQVDYCNRLFVRPFGSWKCILKVRDRRVDIRQEIAEHIEKLPPDRQQEVLRFVASLSASLPVGEPGALLRQYSSSLDPISVEQMRQAILEECEGVEPSDW
jgi:hypothetical protein